MVEHVRTTEQIAGLLPKAVDKNKYGISEDRNSPLESQGLWRSLSAKENFLYMSQNRLTGYEATRTINSGELTPEAHGATTLSVYADPSIDTLSSAISCVCQTFVSICICGPLKIYRQFHIYRNLPFRNG